MTEEAKARFNADLPRESLPDPPAAIVGRRVILPGRTIREEWDTTTGGGKSFIPRRVQTSDARPGTVVSIRELPNGKFRLICDGVVPFPATTGAVLTVLQDKFVCHIDDLYGLLRFLMGKPVASEQIETLREVCAPYLAEHFPDLARVGVPDYGPEVSRYMAFMDGINAIVGPVQSVPVPTIKFDETRGEQR